MATTISHFQKYWNHYCLRLWVKNSLQAFVVGGIFLAGANALQVADFRWPVFLIQICGLLLLCEEWGRLHADQTQALKPLYRNCPQLAEAIHAALDFQNAVPSSPASAYFHGRHLEELVQQFKKKELAKEVPLHWNIGLASGVFLLLAMVMGTFPHMSGGGWFQSSASLEVGHSYRVLYPAYLQKLPLVESALPASLKLPWGSRLEVYFNQEEIPQSIKKKNFYQTSHEKQSLHWFSQKERWIASVNPSETGTLFLQWKGGASQHTLEVIPDLPPKIKVAWPQNRPFFSNSSLPIAFVATDDYGLRNIALHYEVKGQGKHEETIQSFEGQFTEYQETYPWELGATFLRKGDQVTAWLEVSDKNVLQGPNIAFSEKFHFTVGDIKAYHQNIMERLQKIVSDLGQLLAFLDRRALEETLKKEKAILNDLEALRKDAQSDSLLTEELHYFLFSELQMTLVEYQKRRLRLSTLSN